MAGVDGEQLQPGRVVGALTDWNRGEGPLYRRLAAALRDAVEEGRLPSGALLPPERHLADVLSVSRSTVVAALDTLKADGLLDARQGSGTWIRTRRRLPDEGNIELVEELEDHAILRDLGGSPSDTIEFTAAAVECAPEVLDVTRSLDDELLRRHTRGHGYVPMGVSPLREAIAARYSATGLATSPDQVLVTTGATEAVLLAARLFVTPGDPVAIESPSYPGAMDVLSAAGGRLLSVDLDAHGTRVDQLADLLARSLPRLVYLVPDFHNPVGLALEEGRRREVARLAGEFHVPVIEDNVQRELWFSAPPPAPIATHDPDAPILTVGSMSKVFWGGLRIGWVRAAEPTIARLARMKAVTDFGTPIIDQLVATRLLADFDTIAATRRGELATRLDVLTEALHRHLPDWRFESPGGGLILWAQLPLPRAAALARAALDHGVAVVPGPTFGVGDREHADRVRLPFVASPGVIEEGIRRLAAAWEEVAVRSAPPQRHALVV